MAAYHQNWAKKGVFRQKIRPIRVRIGLIWSKWTELKRTREIL